jgi:peroxiredoxin Q/BCP
LAEIRAAGGEVVAVSVDDVERNREVVDRLGLEFPILADTGRDAVAAFGVVHAGGGMGGSDIPRPAVFVIAPDGAVRWRSLADDWRVRLRPERVVQALEQVRRPAP